MGVLVLLFSRVLHRGLSTVCLNKIDTTKQVDSLRYLDGEVDSLDWQTDNLNDPDKECERPDARRLSKQID